MLEMVSEQQEANNQAKRQISNEKVKRRSRRTRGTSQENHGKPLLFQQVTREPSKVPKYGVSFPTTDDVRQPEHTSWTNSSTYANIASETIRFQENNNEIHKDKHYNDSIGEDTMVPKIETVSTLMNEPTLPSDSDIPLPVYRTDNQVSDRGYQLYQPAMEVPVLIAREDIQVNLIRHVEIPHSSAWITNILWTVHALEARFSLPLNKLFINGTFTAHIEYEEPHNNVCIISRNFNWNKVCTVNFIYPPTAQKKREFKVYNFKGKTHHITTHREQIDSYSEKPFVRLRLSRIISSEQTYPKENVNDVSLQVAATLSIDFLQPQLVNSSFAPDLNQ